MAVTTDSSAAATAVVTLAKNPSSVKTVVRISPVTRLQDAPFLVTIHAMNVAARLDAHRLSVRPRAVTLLMNQVSMVTLSALRDTSAARRPVSGLAALAMLRHSRVVTNLSTAPMPGKRVHVVIRPRSLGPMATPYVLKAIHAAQPRVNGRVVLAMARHSLVVEHSSPSLTKAIPALSSLAKTRMVMASAIPKTTARPFLTRAKTSVLANVDLSQLQGKVLRPWLMISR